MRPMLLTALLTALITMAISCKKEEKFNTSDEANGAETAALVESAADVDTMAEESIEVVAELITSATDPLAEQTLFAQAIESVDTSFMSALDQNAIIEAVFAKLDTNSDRQISLTEVSGAIETVAADFGTVDQTKLAQITQFVFPDSSKSHHLDTVKPRISALLNHQKVFKLRARKRMVSHGDIICRRGKTHRSSTLGLVSAKDSGACVRRPYREVSHYAMPFPQTRQKCAICVGCMPKVHTLVERGEPQHLPLRAAQKKLQKNLLLNRSILVSPILHKFYR